MGPKRKSIGKTDSSRKKTKKTSDVVVTEKSDQTDIELDLPEEREINGFKILVPIDIVNTLKNDDSEILHDLVSKYDVNVATEADVEGSFEAIVHLSGISLKIHAFLQQLLDTYIASDDSIQILIDDDSLLETNLWNNPALRHCILPALKSTAKTINISKANFASTKEILNKWPEKYEGVSKIEYSSVFIGNYGNPATFREPQLVNQQMVKFASRQNQTGTRAFESAPTNTESEEAEAGLPPNGIANITTKQGFYQARNQLAFQGKNKQYGNQITLKVTVPQEFVGSLIGKGGTRISEMRNLSGASLRVDMPTDGPPDPNSLRQVAIYGQSEQINVALTLLVKRLEAEMQNKMRKYPS